MPDARWLLSCWEQYGKVKNVFGRPSDDTVISCIQAFPRGTKPIYVQHLLAMQGYHPGCSLQQMIHMVKSNTLGINARDQIYVIKKETTIA